MYILYSGRRIICVSSQELSSEGQNVLQVEVLPCSESELIKEYEVVGGVLIRRGQPWPFSSLRVAMVTSFGENCGMSTYAKNLCDAMRGMVGELRIFAERMDGADAANGLEQAVGTEYGAVRCWDRATGDYQQLLMELGRYDPELVYVQHEYGCLGSGAAWNTLVGHLNSRYRTVVMLHSVYEHQDKLVFEGACEEILVHHPRAREILRKKGIVAPVHWIPHGCSGRWEVDTKFSRMQNEHVLFQYGFGFDYKGWDAAIEVVERLKEQYPDVLYIGVFNVSKYARELSEGYYQRLMDKIVDKGLERNAVLHKGYRSEAVIKSYMAQAAVNLFPYWNHPEWRVYGASGAVRAALASGKPTVVGDVPFFDELKGYIPVCKNVDEYVDVIGRLFDDAGYRKEVIERSMLFIDERSWDKVARWYLSVAEGEDFDAGKLIADEGQNLRLV